MPKDAGLLGRFANKPDAFDFEGVEGAKNDQVAARRLDSDSFPRTSHIIPSSFLPNYYLFT
jgi:hypothetical protein